MYFGRAATCRQQILIAIVLCVTREVPLRMVGDVWRIDHAIQAHECNFNEFPHPSPSKILGRLRILRDVLPSAVPHSGRDLGVVRMRKGPS
jgi:hypothetical protein